jgi:hypothetical protein
METNDPAAMAACPHLLFFYQETFDAQALNSYPVFYQADTISPPVPFIDLLDVATGK